MLPRARAMLAAFVLALAAVHAAKSSGPVVEHVIVFSVDGMHAQDLDYMTTKMNGNLAKMRENAIYYENCNVFSNSDSFPGTAALVTGANPTSTGLYFDDSYSRTLWPAGTPCVNGVPQGPPGTEVLFDSSIDFNSTILSGGGGYNQTSIDPSTLPLNGSCQPVYPNQYLRVNTMFEVAKANGMNTAWADKRPSYSFVTGPSGKGCDQVYTPEISAASSDPYYTTQYDDLHVNAWLNWISGKGTFGQPVPGWTSMPQLMGGDFQTLAMAQTYSNATYQGGYLPGGREPNAMMIQAYEYIDGVMGTIMAALEAAGKAETTAIIVTSKHGESPVDPNHLRPLPNSGPNSPPGVVAAAGIDVLQTTMDTVALFWLANPDDTPAAVNALNAAASELGIAKVYYGMDLLKMGWPANPLHDDRAPNIITLVDDGVFYVEYIDGVDYDVYYNLTVNGQASDHGGITVNDRHVGCMVYIPGISSATHFGDVYTTQVAVTALALLGLPTEQLEGAASEGTAVLPNIPGLESYYAEQPAGRKLAAAQTTVGRKMRF